MKNYNVKEYFRQIYRIGVVPKKCTEQDILHLRNTVDVSALWWKNYVMGTLFLNDLKHSFRITLLQYLIPISQHIHQNQYIYDKLKLSESKHVETK